MDPKRVLCLPPPRAEVLNAVQAEANGALNRAIAAPAIAALAVRALGKVASPDAEKAAGAPWWASAGGELGAAVTIAQPIAAPRLGSASFVGVLATGLVCICPALDHFGLVGSQEPAGSRGRPVGAALMTAGVRPAAAL